MFVTPMQSRGHFVTVSRGGSYGFLVLKSDPTYHLSLLSRNRLRRACFVSNWFPTGLQPV